MKARRPYGFTMIEVIVTTAIICILAALLFPVVKNTMATMNRSSCLAQMAAYGKAIQLYAADNNQSLPGPIYREMAGVYGSWAPTRISSFIAPYLSLPQTTTLAYSKKLQCPAFLRVYKADPQAWGAYSYVLNKQVSLNGAALNPWGNPSGNTSWGRVAPATFPELAALDDGLSKTWMMQDFDGPDAAVASPVHRDFRNRMFFDLHAESVSSR
ncbi:type II secretion system protein [Terrimicrobium sacchariphilum]|nr:type II secretion system protein [Terrimicrobium sacchariphilum]